MLDGSGHSAMEVFDTGAYPDNIRSIPSIKHNTSNFSERCFIRPIKIEEETIGLFT